LDLVAELAGHADVGTCRGYVNMATDRCEAAITQAFDHGRLDLARAR